MTKTEKGVLKEIAYYMLEANTDIEASFREFDRLLDDHNAEKASRLITQMRITRLSLATAVKKVYSLLDIYDELYDEHV
jgi:hypothetical protein